MPMQEGDQFVDFKAFKAAMQDWSVAGAYKFNFRYKKSDALRNIVFALTMTALSASAPPIFLLDSALWWHQ